ncbi:hypothetical protein [Streptomyces sp. NPDC059224]|uniref:hypothetical protein n=1 Tax=Streptomyces sp. NPDC059224 TaxID=3346775 RepID=UPI0036CCC677
MEQCGERERFVADGGPRADPGVCEDAEAEVEADADMGAGPGTDTLLSAREVREKRVVPAAAERRSVVRRNGRPSVPPLHREGVAGGRDKVRRPDAGSGRRRAIR